MTRPKTYDHLRSAKKPFTQSVTLCFDAELEREWNEVKFKLDAARDSVRFRPDDPTATRLVDDLEAEVAQLKDRMAEVTYTFTFRSIGRKRFDGMMEAHPPTQKQVEDAKKRGEQRPNFNVDSFPQELIAASCVSPELSVDDVKDMWDSDDWSSGELGELYGVALIVNNQRRVVDLGKG